MQSNQAPVFVVNTSQQRETGRKAQLNNVVAGRAVADIIRTTLGPRSMLKMILDPMGGIVMTNDGNAILREVDVSHPAAKSMIELSRTQDEEVGDGTTSVIILAGAMLSAAVPFLERNMHPTIIVGAFRRALEDALAVMEGLSTDLDLKNRDELLKLVQSCVGTKFTSRYGDFLCEMAMDAVFKVVVEENGNKEIDIKRYVRVEKVPGDELQDSRVLDGIVVNKDIVHPSMSRRIENPRILLLDCPLEYKKGESQTNIEISNEMDFDTILRIEEDHIRDVCDAIIKLKPTLVMTEKGVSDLAQHFLGKAGISVLRRLRKTDNNRIARAVGAKIGSQPKEMKESDLGTECGLFEVRKIGDEYFTFLEKCKNPKACSVLLRGASKDVLLEIERNLQDAMCVVRNLVMDSKILPGGGATEMAVSRALFAKAASVGGVQAFPYKAVAEALEVIPRTLIENCGAPVIRLLTELRAKHTQSGNETWGIDGNAGVLVDMNKLGIWEPLAVKTQTIKTAIESAAMLLRIDDIVSGIGGKGRQGGGAPMGNDEDPETFGDSRDG